MLLVVYLFLSFIPFPIHDTVISSRHIMFHYHSSMYWLYSSMTFMSSFHTSFSSMFSQLTRHSCISHVRCIEVTNGDKSLRIKSRSQVLNTKWLKTKLRLIFQDLRSIVTFTRWAHRQVDSILLCKAYTLQQDQRGFLHGSSPFTDSSTFKSSLIPKLNNQTYQA